MLIHYKNLWSMNYCDRIQYNIWTTADADMEEMVDKLLLNLPTEQLVLHLVFFCRHTSNEEYVEQKNYLMKKLRLFCGDKMPVVSLVSQPVMGAGMALEVHSYIPGTNDIIKFCSEGDSSYILIENKEAKFLFAGGFQADVLRLNIAEQSSKVFSSLGNILKKEGFPINSIIRQWNYIERITDFDGDDQHYQSFNNARSEFYNNVTWENGYPAATGIGAYFGGVLVDVDAVVFKSDNCYATPINNRLQVAAHKYSEEVLEHSGKIKSTPKFERAKSMTFDNQDIIYISGTAAIRGEESLKGVGLKQQLHTTMENIAELIKEGKHELLRVYLKSDSFYRESRKLLREYDLTIPVVYLHADVCRDELLIEIEGIAKRNNSKQ